MNLTDRHIHYAAQGLGIIHLTIGVSILAASIDRFVSASFRPLLDFTDGVMWPYGLAYVLCGGVMTLGDGLLQRLGLMIGVLVNNVFAALFLVATIQYHDAAPTGIAAYGGYAALDAAVLALLINQRRKSKRQDGG